MYHTRLKELIASLKAVNDQPDTRQQVDEIISILSHLKKKQVDDDQIASYLITIISEFPYMMHHPNNAALEKLCRQLRPATLNLPDFTREKFFGEAFQKHEPSKTKPLSSKR
ncbi:hypothetical protein AQUSIP_11050 [Aquicella siphonis]|uniref:Uncharacterized protein n=1 Tax=Aquicella siphonis TaxID=254247 RepID=A0A5E4PH16_9COXI|nr:hypothetical protein [Aquicella siphonis]VVC75808.1 hypothetical protein AQUSIP_11050 [Aquicella siphonis]